MQAGPAFHAETPLRSIHLAPYPDVELFWNAVMPAASDDQRRLRYVTFLIAVSGLITVARAMSNSRTSAPDFNTDHNDSNPGGEESPTTGFTGFSIRRKVSMISPSK